MSREKVKWLMVKFELSEDKLCGITTDGAPTMVGKHKGSTSIMLKSSSSQNGHKPKWPPSKMAINQDIHLN